MSVLAYDPKTKKRIKDALYDYLYGPINAQFETRLTALISSNSSFYNNTQAYFKYRGTLYGTDVSARVERPTNWLDQQFYAEMEKFLSDRREVFDDEQPYVLGYLNQVLNASDSFQDYYKLFPSALHGLLRQLEDSCPCRQDLLDPSVVDQIKNSNVIAIRRIKRRMTHNLLL